MTDDYGRLPANLSEWERTKARWAYEQASMLARWVMRPQVDLR